MTDVHDKKTRSYNMSMIRGKNTKPEIIVRKFLFSKGYRFRLHSPGLPSKPDIVLPKYKTVIFVNGYFWHGHENCKYFILPKTRTEWWLEKVKKTKERDWNNYKLLRETNWKLIVIVECELKHNVENRFKKLIRDIEV